MSNEELSARLLATFITELEDQARAAGESLSALQRNAGDAEAVQALFRSAHTIKGAARVAGVPIVESVCHALETRIAALRDRGVALRADEFPVLFEVIEALNGAATLLRAGQPLRGTRLDQLLAALATPARPRAPTPTPTAPQREHAAPSVPSPPTPAAAELVRVPLEKINHLLIDANNLVTTTARIESEREAWRTLRGVAAALRAHEEMRDVVRRLDRAIAVSEGNVLALSRVTADLAASVYGLQLRRFGELTEALPRAVEDIASVEGKTVELTVVGEDVEADRVVMDALREPLLHLVRNAVSHGIEAPDKRRAAGKPESGQVTVAAAIAAGKLVVTVTDDGNGIDTTALRETLTARGRATPVSDREVARALFRPGVSTAARATAVSGRGVGLDVVRVALERVGGNVNVKWKAGAGTKFTLEAPPSSALMRVVLARVGNHTFAFPINSVDRVVRIRAVQLRSVQGRVVIDVAGTNTALTSLASLLGPPLVAQPVGDTAFGIVLSSSAGSAAVIVDELTGEDEIVLRPIDHARHSVAHAVGGALLPSGEVALVLNGASLVEEALHADGDEVLQARPEAKAVSRILVADDSFTTRTLEQSVLQAAGYQVSTAVDGQDAWDQLQREAFDAVVADVEMPRLTGFDLCERIRASKRLAELPVILVTGLEAPEDRARGLEAGADAYIVKSSFDQAELIRTLRRLAG